MVKCLIFQCFVELITELGNGNQRVDRRDMPFPAIEHLFKNVNYAPSWRKTYHNSTVLWYLFYCQVKLLYTCNDPTCYSVKQKYLTGFGFDFGAIENIVYYY